MGLAWRVARGGTQVYEPTSPLAMPKATTPYGLAIGGASGPG